MISCEGCSAKVRKNEYKELHCAAKLVVGGKNEGHKFYDLRYYEN